MSVKAVQWACDVSGCNSAEKAVLFVLANAHNGKSGKCCPGQAYVAERAGMTEKPLRKAIITLILKGFISREITSRGSGLITAYTLHLDRLEPREITPAKAPSIPSRPNGTRIPSARKTTKRDTHPVRVPQNQTGHASPLVNGDQTGDLGIPNGIRVPFHIEEPEGTGISPSPSAYADYEGPQTELFPNPSKQATVVASRELLMKGIVFQQGVPLLLQQGLSESNARSFFGKQIKNSNLEIVARVVSNAIREMPVDARGWITKAVLAEARRAGIRPKGEPPPPIDWRATLRGWFDTGHWPRGAGPLPTERGYQGPLDQLEALLPEFEEGHPFVGHIRRVIEARSSTPQTA